MIIYSTNKQRMITAPERNFLDYLEVKACPLRQILDLNVKLQPAVPQHFFTESFRGGSLLKNVKKKNK